MRGKAHLATGLIAGLVAAISTVSATTQIAEPIALTVAAAVGSLIPDMDLPTSTVGKKLKPISWTVNKMFGHRTITHAPIWLIPLIILYIKFPTLITSENAAIWQQALLGYIVGFTCHLMGDILTKGGIPFFYPFSKKRVHLTGAESGKHDIILSIVVIAVFAPSWIFVLKNNI